MYEVITCLFCIFKKLVNISGTKEIYENSKRHFSSYTDYLFAFKNDFDKKDAIFVMLKNISYHFVVYNYLFVIVF